MVTSLEFRLHPVKDIYGGPMFFELSEAENVLRFYREYIADAPEQMGAFPAFQIAPPLPFIPEDRHGDTFIAIVACWAGPVEEGETALKPFHDVAPVVAEFVGPMPYPALNSAFDALVPPGLQHYWKASFVKRADRRGDRGAREARARRARRELDDAHLPDQRGRARVGADATRRSPTATRTSRP